MTTRRQLLLGATRASGALLAGLAVGQARAQAFPTRPVKIITAFPAGAGPDAALRVVAQGLSKKWGQPVIIENKAGGNGFIAVAAFKNAAPDGHELIQLDNTHITTHPHTFSKLPYDPQKDFVPLSMILRTYFFVAVAKDSKLQSIDDIVAAAKAQPGRLPYGSWGNGSPGHLGALMLESLKGIKMTHVPYRDFGQLFTAVANGEVAWSMGSAGSAGPLERAGKLRFLAIAGPKREPTYPNVPATAESPTMKGYEVSGWAGLFAPAGTPPALRDRLGADIADVLAQPDVVERYKVFGYEAPDLDPTQFAQLIQRETRDWAGIIKEARLKLD